MRGPRRARRDAPGPLRGPGRCIDTAIDGAPPQRATRHRATTLRRDRRRPRPWRPHRAMAFAQAADAPLSTSSTSRARRRWHVVRGRRRPGVRVHAETCPHYLTLTDDRYDERRPGQPAPATSSRRRSAPAADRDALWAGLADGTLDLVATDHVPDRSRRREERGRVARRVRPDLERRARDRDAAHDGLRRRRGRAAGLTVERMVDVLSTTPARLFGLGRRARSRPAATPTSCSSTLPPAARSGRPTSTTRATTRRTRASTSREPCARVRPRPCRRPRRRVRRRSRLRPLRRAWRGRGIATAGQGQAIGR